MEAKACEEQLGLKDGISCDCVDKLEKCAAMEADDVVHLSSPPLVLANSGASLVPITPELMSKFPSPLTLVSSPPSHSHHNGYDGYLNEDDDDHPCTPREGVFDPFAPGPDKLLLAPQCMKYLEESRSFVARRLNFSSRLNNDGPAKRGRVAENESEDEMLLETVYDSLLEAIISKQAEDILAEISTLDLSSDELRTPPSAPRLTGIAETCPGAPLRPVRKLRNIDLSLCRKLEFDF